MAILASMANLIAKKRELPGLRCNAICAARTSRETLIEAVLYRRGDAELIGLITALPLARDDPRQDGKLAHKCGSSNLATNG